jgi:hypothetical protein
MCCRTRADMQETHNQQTFWGLTVQNFTQIMQSMRKAVIQVIYIYIYIYISAGFHETHGDLTNVCGHDLWWFFGRNLMRKVEWMVKFVPSFDIKCVFHCSVFSETGNRSSGVQNFTQICQKLWKVRVEKTFTPLSNVRQQQIFMKIALIGQLRYK